MFENNKGELTKFKIPYFDDEVTPLFLCSLVLGMIVSGSWYFTYNWLLNNIVALSLAFTFLKTVRLNRLVPGVILLSSLFFYDIFWVFYSTKFTKGGQSVMIAVATSFEAPIKLIMPRLSAIMPASRCSMLGLGDIVIPGIYIGFLIRFGRHTVVGEGNPYTLSVLLSYTLSLAACGACLIIYQQGQPALLYIVPALLGITFFQGGLIRGELTQMTNEGVDMMKEVKGYGGLKKRGRDEELRRVEREMEVMRDEDKDEGVESFGQEGDGLVRRERR